MPTRRSTSLLKTGFLSVARCFAPASKKIWNRGIQWIANHQSSFGVLSWEPFFIGLLNEPQAFAGRSMEALLNRKRLLRRLTRLESEHGRSRFYLDDLRSEMREFPEEYASPDEMQDFWARVILLNRRAKLELSPEATLRMILDAIERSPRGDWEQEGRKYLDHPGVIGDSGLLADAIIGETAGSDLSFSEALKGLLNQHEAEVSVAIAQREGKLVVAPYSTLGACTIGRMASPIVSAVEAQLINHVRLVEESAFSEFEALINSRSLSERSVHEFFESFPAFLCLGTYVGLKSHAVLTLKEDARLIPDFFLEREDTGFSDILELKLPSAPVVVGAHNRRLFSSVVHRSIAQLKEYSSYFNEEGHRLEFEHQTDLKLFRPNLVLLIGRSTDFRSAQERRGLELELEGHVKIRTYDDILESAKQKRLYVDRQLARRVPRTSNEDT